VKLAENAARAMAARASSLEERLRSAVDVIDSPESSALCEKRLQEWMAELARNHSGLFALRLKWDGLTFEEVKPVLGDVGWPEGAQLLPWLNTIQNVLCIAEDPSSVDDTCCACDPLPFQEILTPFVVVARRRLRQKGGDAYELLAPIAHHACERELLLTLVLRACQALQLEFSILRASTLSPLSRLLAEAEEDRSCALYLRFVDEMRREGLARFFEEYAVLARQLTLVADLWVDAQTELIERLQTDKSELEELFETSLGQVACVETGLSDPHHGRRCVLMLAFESGTKIIYKPKNLGMEKSFQDLLTWINGTKETLDMRVLRILPREEYGWVEYIEHRPCATPEEASRHFIRAGMLLCLVHALQGVDCHRDNLIAEGEYPVLVDCETLMQPHPCFDDIGDAVLARHLAKEQLAHSVLRTGMLPSWDISHDGKKQHAYDVSALGGVHDLEEEVQRIWWTDVNTDHMEVGLQSVKMSVKLAGAMFNGEVLHLKDWHEQTIAGFRSMYSLLLRHRNDLLDRSGPVCAMARRPIRFIYRDTQAYATMNLKLMLPQYQRDGADRSLQIDLLCRVLLPKPSAAVESVPPSRWWPIIAAERLMLQQEDIPYFETTPDENALRLPGNHAMTGIFQEPSINLVLEKIARMDSSDLELQVDLIVASLYSLVARTGIPIPMTGNEVNPGNESGITPNHSDFVSTALAIADEICTRAIRSQRSATWIGPQLMYRAQRYQLQNLGNDLYTGVAGIILFLAAAGRVSGKPEIKELAFMAAAPLRDDIEQMGPRLARDMGIGGAIGLGSLVYVFTKMARLLGDDSALETAARAAALITDDLVASDAAYDVFEGAAGALLALLALYGETHDPAFLEQAEKCGRHLLRRAVTAPGGHRAWITIDNKMPAGFSHGVAGIAGALARLSVVVGDPQYIELARDAIAYEDSLFCPETGNWLDLRAEPPQRLFTASWCHGAPGIALGRLVGLDALDGTDIRRDIEAAVQVMKAAPVSEVDHPCCGNIGIDEILLFASAKLARPELAALAARRSWQVVLRARRTGTYALDPLLSVHTYSPSFFQGCAGIGYTLLRHAYPSELPSILAFE